MNQYDEPSAPSDNLPVTPRQCICPTDSTKGKPIEITTLKSLLTLAALEQLNP